MPRTILLASILLAPASPGWTQVDDVVSYTIEATLDPLTHRISGSERVRWSNHGGVPTAELWWHLYLNAFSGEATTFMRGVGQGGFGSVRMTEGGWGWTRITRLVLGDGTDLLPELEFERPDDGNLDDFTVAVLRLPRPVPPGAAVELELDFEAQLPRIIARTGAAGDFHFAGQWFPKLGVFQGERGWSCHQLHETSEFFADYGSYRVAVNLPAHWVIAGTGIEVERQERDGGQRVVFTASRVHDFAWCAGPSNLMAVIEETFEPGRDVPMAWLDRARNALGMGAADLELPSIHLRLIMPRSQLRLADRLLRAARFGVAWCGLHYGPYPYPQLTVVVPPPSAEAAGGMEYPTLVTTLSSRLFSVPPLSRLPLIEMVTIHEVGHQYFYGLVGSNEAERAWLDEGLTSFTETSCTEAISEDGLADDIFPAGGWVRRRAALATARTPLQPDVPSWRYRDRASYRAASYGKTALALKTLEGMIGERAFATAMRTYVDRYRYAHPTGDDLYSVFEEVAGEDLDWFFDQAIGGDATVDWSVLGVRNDRARSPRGLVWNDAERQWQDAGVGEPPGWNVVIDVGRLGDFVGPVDVLLRFTDGRQDRRRWDGEQRWTRWRMPSAAPLAEVVVDPDAVWALETRRSDNYWRARPRRAAVRHHLWWVAEALQLVSLLQLPWS